MTRSRGVGVLMAQLYAVDLEPVGELGMLGEPASAEIESAPVRVPTLKGRWA